MEEPNRCYRHFGTAVPAIRKSVLAASLLGYPTIGLAYIGPGLGAGALAMILGILGSIVLALFAIFWYPFKRILKRRKQKRTGELQEADSQSKARD